MNNTIKLEPLFDYYGQILVFKYNGMNYISLEDAEKMRHYIRSNIEVPEETDFIKIFIIGAGMPDFVNVEKSIKTGNYTFYEAEDIQWYPTPIEEYNP